jgi:hypothetical protein
MERRRCLRHGYWLALLTGVAAGFLLCAALATRPPAVECRETVRFIEEAGDPDMPDRAESEPVRSYGLTISLPGSARLLELESREKWLSKPTPRHAWLQWAHARRTAARLIGAWSSIASWHFAF